jgi:tRNA-specific 2-thiouridylase
MIMGMKIKAIALISGGLDSALAVKVMLEQGIDVAGLHFALPFAGHDKNRNFTEKIAEELGISLRVESMGIEYLELVRHPKYGYGAGINPCIDCKIFMLKRAKAIAEETGAEFIITGEVLEQRPMSQRRRALGILERESGLNGRLLRPLSAKHLPETIPEREGLVKRDELPCIHGRSREIQLALAKEKNISFYMPAAGGCLLTDRLFAKKMKDLLQHNEDITWDDVLMLEYGRHFRFGENKIIVGRNERENNELWTLKRPGDYVFELPDEIPGPAVVLQGEKRPDAMGLAAGLTIRYSDLKQDNSEVLYGEERLERKMAGNISVLNRLDFYNITTHNK